jgi:PPE-repeat protein
VPPPLIAANRTLLAALVATNIVGQNTAAIADTEAQYADFWAQDAAAMAGYCAASMVATTQLPRFATANKSTNDSGVSAQHAAVATANAKSGVNKAAAQTLSALSSQAQPQPQVQAAPNLGAGGGARPGFAVLDAIQGTGVGFSAPYNMEQFVSGIIGAENNLGMLAKPGAAAANLAPALAAPALRGATSGLGGGLGNVTATLSHAGRIGPMSVPASWSAPTSTHISPLEPAGFTTLPGTEEPVASGYPGYPGVPGGGAARNAGAGVPPRYGVRLTVMPRPPAAG